MNLYSEFGEDKWILEHLELPAGGFYLDVGCAHPCICSNTAFLRDRGWSGLAIDANPAWAQAWRGAPNCNFVAGIVSTRPLVTFDFKEMPTHSRVQAGGQLFAATRLDEIIRHCGRPEIDFLTLDVEGHEFEALESLMFPAPEWLSDFTRTHSVNRPRIIVSEFSTAGIGDDYRVRDRLLVSGYKLVHQTVANLIFLRE